MANTKIEMKKQADILRQALHSRYKPSLWQRFRESMGDVAVFLLILIFLIGLICVAITLIEYPVSLAVICIFLFLIYAWRRK